MGVHVFTLIEQGPPHLYIWEKNIAFFVICQGVQRRLLSKTNLGIKNMHGSK